MAWAEPYGKNLFRGRYKRPDGTIGSLTGYRTAKAAKNAAIAEEEKIRAQGRKWKDPNAGDVLFKDWTVEWWEAQGLAVTSMDGYERTVRLMILPYFGEKSIGEISPLMIKKWEKWLKAKDYAPSSIATAHARLHTILHDAVVEGLIEANPATRGRRRGAVEDQVDDEDQDEELWVTPLNALLLAERCAILGGRDEDFVFAIGLAWTGARLAEFVGLERSLARVKLHRKICIHWQLVEVKGKWHRKRPKGGRTRDVELPPFLTSLFADQVAAGEKNICRCEDRHEVRGQAAGTFVFLGRTKAHHRRSNYYRQQFTPAGEGFRPPRGGQRTPVYVSLIDQPWPGIPVSGRRNQAGRADETWSPIPVENPELRDAGKRLTPHSLRHSHKTWLVEDGIPEVAQDERLGHNRKRRGGSGRRYTHVSEAMKRRIIECLERRWDEALRARFEICPNSPVPILERLLEPLRVEAKKNGGQLRISPSQDASASKVRNLG